MKMNLLDVPVYVISPGRGQYRRRIAVCFQRLVDYGFSRIVFVRSIEDPSKTASLSLTTLSILEKEAPPYIIMDDDVEEFHIRSEADVPEDAAACYLGVSRWVFPYPASMIGKGYHIRPSEPIDFRDAGDDWVRVSGMTSSHAILFLDPGFIAALADKIRGGRSVPHDLYLAALQQEYPVYALKTPLFFQDHSIGGQEDVTRLRWDTDNFILA
jgi:hypothetical protein